MAMTDRWADKQNNNNNNNKIENHGGGGAITTPGAAPVHNYTTQMSAELPIWGSPWTRIRWKFGKS